MEWLIDIIKEWVEKKKYATEAWVTEWFTPYSVTGALNPNATCLYFKAGTHDGKPYYRRSDGKWFIWWDPPQTWVISHKVGWLVPISWFRVDPNIEGPYLEGQTGIGIATVSLGHRSLCTGYVDRGDPAVVDFTLGNLIKDSAWHELDLSSIVPADAKAVALSVRISNDYIDKIAMFRKHGNVNDWNVSRFTNQVARAFYETDCQCPVDNDRKIDYFFTANGWSSINITVKNWWL